MTHSEDWDRSAPWVYETAAPDWVSELARELPNRRRARGIELDPDDQYYPSEDDFDDEPSSADDWYTPHDAPLRHPGSAGIRSVPDEPVSRTRRGAGRDDGRALPDWADGAEFSARADEAARSAGAGEGGRYRPEHRPTTDAYAADELAPRRRRRAAPEPGAHDPGGHDPGDRSWRLDDHPPVGRRPVGAVDDVRADDVPIDDRRGGRGGRGRDPYRWRAEGSAGWSPPDTEREHGMASHPSQYVDRPATGRARVPQPRADGPHADNPWTTAAALPPVHHHDGLLDDRVELPGDLDGRLAGDLRATDGRPVATRNPWVLDAGDDPPSPGTGRRHPYDAEPGHDGPHRGHSGQAGSGRNAGDRRWSTDSPLPTGAEPGERVSPTGRAAADSGPARPATPGSGADPALPRIISTAAAPVTPRVISRSSPPAVPRVVSRSTPPAIPRVISTGAPTAAPKPASPALRPPATTVEPAGGPPQGMVARGLSAPPPPGPAPLRPTPPPPPGPAPLRPTPPPPPGPQPGNATPADAPDGSAAARNSGAARQSRAHPAPASTPGTNDRAEPGDAQIIPLRRRAAGPVRGEGRAQPDVAAPQGDPRGSRPGTTTPHGGRAVGTAAVPRPEVGYGSPAPDVAAPPDGTRPPEGSAPPDGSPPPEGSPQLEGSPAPGGPATLHPPTESRPAVSPGGPGRDEARPVVPGRTGRADGPRAPGPATAADLVESGAARADTSTGSAMDVGQAGDERPGDALRDAIAPEDLLPTALLPGPDPSPGNDPAPGATPAPESAAEPAGPDAEPPAEPPAAPPDEVVLAAIRWRLDGATLREVVDDRDELLELGVRLDRPLSASDDNVSRARLLCLRAEVYRLLGELGMAAAASRLALAHAEAAADRYAVVVAQGELAHVLRLRGDFAEADRLFEQAASAEVPELLRCVIHENAGRCCFDQGRYMEALDHFSRAIRLGDPHDLELVERIDVALEAVYIRLLRDGWGPYPRLRREIMAAVPGPDRHPAPGARTARQQDPDAGTTPVTVAPDDSAPPPETGPAHDADTAQPAGTVQPSDAVSTVAAAEADLARETGAPPPVRVPTQTQRAAPSSPGPTSAEPAPETPPPSVAAPPAPAAVAAQEPPAAAPARPDTATQGSWFVSRT